MCFNCIVPLRRCLTYHLTCLPVCVCSANKEMSAVLNEPIKLNLDDALEYIIDDELVEVTPIAVRVRKSPRAIKPQRGSK